MSATRQNVLIGIIICLTSQVYWNFFVEGFRVSTAVILLPVLLMTLAKQQRPVQVGGWIGLAVFCFRTCTELLSGTALLRAMLDAFPGTVFYLFYCFLFGLLLRRRHLFSLTRIGMLISICDFASNIVELSVKTHLRFAGITERTVLYLVTIALVRAALAVLCLVGERHYRSLLTRAEHEARYQKLFLMTTGLKNEIYFMRKNSEEIESVMSNAYTLYEKLSELELPPETQKVALSIARDVHEIKKDYIRIIQGLEQEVVEQYDENTMSCKDILRILEDATWRSIEEKKLQVQLEFRINHDFQTKKHYALMAILKNLVGNALEAIEASGKDRGKITVDQWMQNNTYFFTITDTGCGIKEQDQKRIFQMGFSTKFDYKTGNIYRGVGLSGVKMTLEEQLGGTVTVQSSLGEYTTFTVEIPRQKLEEYR